MKSPPKRSPLADCQQCWQPLNAKCAGLQVIRTEEMFHLFSTFGPRSQTDKTFGRAFVENILLNLQQAHPRSNPAK